MVFSFVRDFIRESCKSGRNSKKWSINVATFSDESRKRRVLPVFPTETVNTALIFSDYSRHRTKPRYFDQIGLKLLTSFKSPLVCLVTHLLGRWNMFLNPLLPSVRKGKIQVLFKPVYDPIVVFLSIIHWSI